MPDELRLRCFVSAGGDTHDAAFVIGGTEVGPMWVGGRVVCGFGIVRGSLEPRPGRPPSPEDARRIELCWNLHDDLVASLMETRDAAAMLCRFIAAHVSVEFADRITPNRIIPDDYAGFGARADAVIDKAREGTAANCPVPADPDESSPSEKNSDD